jgi:hypothetical protein
MALLSRPDLAGRNEPAPRADVSKPHGQRLPRRVNQHATQPLAHSHQVRGAAEQRRGFPSDGRGGPQQPQTFANIEGGQRKRLCAGP